MTQEEREAEMFLRELEQNTTEIIPIDDSYSKEGRKVMNNRIIEKADNILYERLENGDVSLSVKDIIALKAEAFKENQIIDGNDPSNIDASKFIPTNINIQIINN